MKSEFATVPVVATSSEASAAPLVSARGTLLGLVAGALVLVAYLLACHVATTRHSAWGPWLYAAPLFSMLFSAVALRWGNVAGAAACVPMGLAIAWGLPRWQGGVGAFYVVQHVGTNLALCWLFAYTLMGGREPLITRFARIMRRGDMPPEVLSYTRWATLAWALFFAGIAAASALLYASAPIDVWSTFSNLVCGPLVGLMFAIEYAVRRTLLRGIRHHAFMDAVHLFRQPWPAAKPDTHPR